MNTVPFDNARLSHPWGPNEEGSAIGKIIALQTFECLAIGSKSWVLRRTAGRPQGGGKTGEGEGRNYSREILVEKARGRLDGHRYAVRTEESDGMARELVGSGWR